MSKQNLLDENHTNISGLIKAICPVFWHNFCPSSSLDNDRRAWCHSLAPAGVKLLVQYLETWGKRSPAETRQETIRKFCSKMAPPLVSLIRCARQSRQRRDVARRRAGWKKTQRFNKALGRFRSSALPS